MHVPAVEDQLDRHALVAEGRDDRAGRAVVDARHRVERVGEQSRPAVEGLTGDLERGIGVPDGHRDHVLHEHVDHVEGVGQLGRDRDLPKGSAARLEQLVHLVRRRLEQKRGVVRSASGGGQEWTLEVRSKHERVARGEVGEPCAELGRQPTAVAIRRDVHVGASTADAAFVPWALCGMRHTVRPASPRER